MQPVVVWEVLGLQMVGEEEEGRVVDGGRGSQGSNRGRGRGGLMGRERVWVLEGETCTNRHRFLAVVLCVICLVQFLILIMIICNVRGSSSVGERECCILVADSLLVARGV